MSEPKLTREVLPSFASAYPDHPELNDLVSAFSRGDFLYVQTKGNVLLKSEAFPTSLHSYVSTLIRRTKPGRFEQIILAITTLLLLVLSLYFIFRSSHVS